MRKYRVSTKEAGAKHYWKHTQIEAVLAYMRYYKKLGYKDVEEINCICLKRRSR